MQVLLFYVLFSLGEIFFWNNNKRKKLIQFTHWQNFLDFLAFNKPLAAKEVLWEAPTTYLNKLMHFSLYKELEIKKGYVNKMMAER